MTTSTALVPVTNDEHPPAFPGLTDMQSAFVRCYVANGDGNATKAARDAGYSPASARNVGCRWMRDDGVLAAMQRETARAFGPLAVQAQGTMARLLKAKSEFVRQQAASDLLDRAGFKPPDRHQVAVGGSITIDIKLTD